MRLAPTLIIAALAVAGCAVSPGSDGGSGVQATAAPPPESESLAKTILLDGVVDRVEYEQAAQRMTACAEELGAQIELVPHTSPGSDEVAYGLRSDTPGIIDDCSGRVGWDDIDRARAAQDAPSNEQQQQQDRAFRDCLADAGLDYRRIDEYQSGGTPELADVVADCATQTGWGVVIDLG